MPDEIEVCPECDQPGILSNVQTNIHSSPSKAAYRCRRCGANFDEPHERPRKSHGNTRNGLAGRLADDDTELATDGGRVIDEAKPAGPDDLAAVDQGKEVVLQYQTVDGHGIESIRGPACHIHESDTAVTVTVRDQSRGIFDLILTEVGDGYALDAGIEGQTHATGYVVKDIDEIEALEIHKPTTDGGVDVDEDQPGAATALEDAEATGRELLVNVCDHCGTTGAGVELRTVFGETSESCPTCAMKKRVDWMRTHGVEPPIEAKRVIGR